MGRAFSHICLSVWTFTDKMAEDISTKLGDPYISIHFEGDRSRLGFGLAWLV